MRVEKIKKGEATVLGVGGRLTAGRAEGALRQAVDLSLSEGPDFLFLDLARVSVMDAAGVGELASSYVKAKDVGCELALIAPPTQVVTLLTLCGLGDFFPVFRSTFDALTSAEERSTVPFPMAFADSASPAFRAPSVN